MHPIFSDARRLLCYVAAWFLVGTLIAGLLIAADEASWVNALFFAIPICLVYGFVAMSAYYVCRTLPLAQRSLFKVAVTFGGSSLISGALLLSLCVAWVQLGYAMGADWSAIAIARQSKALLFGLGVGFYLLSLLAHDVLIAMENLRAAEQREAESRMLAREAELQMLRTQINPHFLFNSLNSISALTAIDAAAARAMTIALAQFFRQTLTMADKRKITLARELTLCEHFLTVEKIRFGRKLDVDVHAEAAALQGLIPPMILQPLLENAIKHGIRNMTDGGMITVRVALRDAWLHISVENPVEEDVSLTPGNGMGLQNIRQRCAALYDGRARVTWGSGDNRLFVVELAIPFELET